MSKNFAVPLSGGPCIADGLSHTTCVETNNRMCIDFKVHVERRWKFTSHLKGNTCGILTPTYGKIRKHL